MIGTSTNSFRVPDSIQIAIENIWVIIENEHPTMAHFSPNYFIFLHIFRGAHFAPVSLDLFFDEYE